ncbi:MAG: hypothetical protein BWY11_01236 [Firmicutes bacterium ADurb.Bin182]|nr:MAG: hypothetical protein BWY11_01236 [Firmicutes bacterium ADurb.Bin182]
MKKRTLAIALAITVLILSAVGGTLAWLTAVTAPVENVFTFGDVEITLNDNYTKPQYIVPGDEVNKEVSVTNDGTVSAWVFVKVVIPDEFKIEDSDGKELVTLDYNDTDWELVNSADNVWGYKSELATSSFTNNLFTKLTFDGNITSDQISAMQDAVITVQAAAIQFENVSGTVNDAWAKLGSFPEYIEP